MNRKCQLPIQDDVSVYTYTYYGFANSIIQAVVTALGGIGTATVLYDAKNQ
mgnify:CR=1 FL=1